MPSPDISTLVSVVIINFNTPDLTRRATVSLRQHYPRLPLLLIDNGSSSKNSAALNELQERSAPFTTIIFNRRNLHHGPAMDWALRYLNSHYVLFLDSDCEVFNEGFIESMAELLGRHPLNYAAGHHVYMNKRGFDVSGPEGAFEYIRPYCMMLRREMYFTLPRFQRHGAPCFENMKSAVLHGYLLIDFPVSTYVHHMGRGTAGKFGYRLGLRGRINYLLNKAGF